MIAITPRDIDNTVYVDYKYKVMVPYKYTYMDTNTGILHENRYKPIPEDMIEVIDDSFIDFMEDNAEVIVNPILGMLENYNEKTVGGYINTTDLGSINYFLYNIKDTMEKSRYYQNIADYFCNIFNSMNNTDVYVYFDHMEFRVYDKIKNDYYIIIKKEKKEPEIVLYKDFCRKHKIKYDKKECKLREEMLQRNLEKAEDKCGFAKNLVFMVIFKFATTVKNYPMLILNPNDLK